MNGFICKGASSSSELLKAQAHIWNHIFNFINSGSLKCAVEMGIPDIIHNHGQPMTLPALLNALPVHHKKAQHVYRLMRILINSGFFAMRLVSEENNEEGYVLTPSSHYLLSDNPLSMAPFLLCMLDPLLIRPWNHMSTWFKNDEDPTPFETTYGRSFWEVVAVDPQQNTVFNDAMASDARLITSVVLEKCGDVFEGVKRLVDVGGGTGTMAYAIAKAFPKLRCINFDLPYVVAGLEDTENVKHVEGDMFESIPQADATFLKWILHDWSDEECVKILRNCKEAIMEGGKGGKVIIIDMVVSSKDSKCDDQVEATETQLFFDMLLMAITTGREREEKEWADIFKKSGFSTYKITHVLGHRSMIELFP